MTAERIDRREEATPEGVGELLDALRGLEAGAPALEAGLARLFAVGPPAYPLLVDRLASEDEEDLALALHALKRAPAPAVVPLLLAFLQTADAPDLGKGLALIVLEHHGLDTTDPALFSPTLDLEAIWEAQGKRQAEPPEGSGGKTPDRRGS
ncbi:MAG TPA: hypothetical protein VGT06_03165 [Candidatus Methylomirabilis sp.]|nr:hypothetical protein [Candidatus Methylomirabilis sp.]